MIFSWHGALLLWPPILIPEKEQKTLDINRNLYVTLEGSILQGSAATEMQLLVLVTQSISRRSENIPMVSVYSPHLFFLVVFFLLLFFFFKSSLPSFLAAQ